MAAKADPYLIQPAVAAAELPAVLGRAAAVVLPMPRVTADGHPMIDNAAGGRLGPARGVLLGAGLGISLWAGLLSLAWRMLH